MKKALIQHTGAGKTKICLDYIVKNKFKVLLVSTKKIVSTSWINEINKWNIPLTYDYLIGGHPITSDTDIVAVSVDMLQKYIHNNSKIKSKRKYKTLTGFDYTYSYDYSPITDKYDLLIVDEVTLFKNYSSARSKAMHKFSASFKNILILTATPNPNSLENFWSEIYILDQGERLGKNITEFRRRFGYSIKISPIKAIQKYTQNDANQVLNLIKDLMYVDIKKESTLYPEPKVFTHYVDVDDYTKRVIQQFNEHSIVTIKGKTIYASNKLERNQKLTQLSSGFIYDNETTIRINDAKIRYIKDLISSVDTPILIASHYKEDTKLLLKLGAKRIKNAQDELDWNDNKIPLAVLSPQADAQGLNLQFSNCENLIWMSPTWDAEIWKQLISRICRRGQTRVVNIIVLAVKDTVDDYIQSHCLNKFKTMMKGLVKLE